MSVHQELQIIGLLSPADQQAGGITPDSINMGLLHKVQIIFLTGVVTGDGATIQFYSGATNAAKTTEFYPYYRLGGADIGTTGSDVRGARTVTPSGGILLTAAASWDETLITVDIQSDELTAGQPFLTMSVEDGSASALFMAIVAIGWPRFEGHTHVTVV